MTTESLSHALRTPAMADPYVRELGAVDDLDASPVDIGVDYDTVFIRSGGHLVRLTRTDAADFAHLFAAACWEAGGNEQRMRQDAP